MCQSDVSIFGIGLFLLGLGEWDSVIWGEKVLKSFANNTVYSLYAPVVHNLFMCTDP